LISFIEVEYGNSDHTGIFLKTGKNNLDYGRVPCLRASPRHGGATLFIPFENLSFKPFCSATGAPRGGGGVHPNRGMGVSTPIKKSEIKMFLTIMIDYNFPGKSPSPLSNRLSLLHHLEPEGD
jgi:hypothetical protein